MGKPVCGRIQIKSPILIIQVRIRIQPLQHRILSAIPCQQPLIFLIRDPQDSSVTFFRSAHIIPLGWQNAEISVCQVICHHGKISFPCLEPVRDETPCLSIRHAKALRPLDPFQAIQRGRIYSDELPRQRVRFLHHQPLVGLILGDAIVLPVLLQYRCVNHVPFFLHIKERVRKHLKIFCISGIDFMLSVYL